MFIKDYLPDQIAIGSDVTTGDAAGRVATIIAVVTDWLQGRIPWMLMCN